MRETLPVEYQAHFDRLMCAVPNPDVWAIEMAAMLDAMPGHLHVLPEQLGHALRDLLANGKDRHPVMRQFRNYIAGVLHGDRGRASTPSADAVRADADRIWALCKKSGIHHATKDNIDTELAKLVAAGDITDAAAFRATLRKLDLRFLRVAHTDHAAITSIAEKLAA